MFCKNVNKNAFLFSGETQIDLRFLFCGETRSNTMVLRAFLTPELGIFVFTPTIKALVFTPKLEAFFLPVGRSFQWDTDHIFHQTDGHGHKHTHIRQHTHTERCDEMWEGQLCDQYHEQESAMGRIRQWPIRLRLTSPCMCGRPVTIDWPRNPMALADSGEKKRRQMKRKIANALQAGILICDRGGIWWKPLSHS